MKSIVKGNGKFFFFFNTVLLFYYFNTVLFVLLFFLVLVLFFFCFIIFFNTVLTWKIVGASKASVIYIYIYIYIDDQASIFFHCFTFFDSGEDFFIRRKDYCQ